MTEDGGISSARRQEGFGAQFAGKIRIAQVRVKR